MGSPIWKEDELAVLSRMVDAWDARGRPGTVADLSDQIRDILISELPAPWDRSARAIAQLIQRRQALGQIGAQTGGKAAATPYDANPTGSPAARQKAAQKALPAGAVPDPVPVIDTDPVALGDGPELKPRLTIVVSDMQFGEGAFLLRSWNDVAVQIAGRVRAAKPAIVTLIVNGDAVTGGGVFRDQELVVQLPTTDPQVAYCAIKLRDLLDRCRAAADPETVFELILTPGNHDRSKGKTDTMVALVFALRVIGIPATYYGRPCIVDLAAPGADPFFVWVDHGHGGSSYYANSYAQIREVWKFLVEQADYRANADRIRRVVVGHTHWLQIGYHVAGEVFLDTAGGWTRQERIDLGLANRRVGAIVYVHDGKSFTPTTVTPSRATFQEDREGIFLHEDNAADQVEGLRAFKGALVELGIIAGRTARG